MISLRPLAKEDAGQLADWGMDRDFRVAAGWSDRTHDEYRRFCSDHIANGSDDEVMLGVTDQDRLVGYVCFYLDKSKQGCELGIAIGPSSNWSRGYGRQAITSATRYAMIELGAVNVWAQTHPANIAARRMLEAAGYVETGTRGAVEEYRGEAAPLSGTSHQNVHAIRPRYHSTGDHSTWGRRQPVVSFMINITPIASRAPCDFATEARVR